MLIRELTRAEVERVWEIDRREVIERVYHLRDGRLILEAELLRYAGVAAGGSEAIHPPLARLL